MIIPSRSLEQNSHRRSGQALRLIGVPGAVNFGRIAILHVAFFLIAGKGLSGTGNDRSKRTNCSAKAKGDKERTTIYLLLGYDILSRQGPLFSQHCLTSISLPNSEATA